VEEDVGVVGVSVRLGFMDSQFSIVVRFMVIGWECLVKEGYLEVGQGWFILVYRFVVCLELMMLLYTRELIIDGVSYMVANVMGLLWMELIVIMMVMRIID